jgi:hypothetical protein
VAIVAPVCAMPSAPRIWCAAPAARGSQTATTTAVAVTSATTAAPTTVTTADRKAIAAGGRFALCWTYSEHVRYAMPRGVELSAFARRASREQNLSQQGLTILEVQEIEGEIGEPLG